MSLQTQVQAELELRRRAQSGEIKKSKYKEFQEKYRNDLAGFANDCISWREKEYPTDYQLEGMRRLVKYKRFSLRGPHGLGKTMFAAIAVLWFALTRDGEDWKIPTLASAWRQVSKFLWPEIRKWSRRLKWGVIGRNPFNENRELLTLSLKLSTGEAFAMASNDESLIEGAHADNILYLFDESKSIPDATWDAAEGAMSTTGECYWLAVSTPGEPIGRFFDIHSKKGGYEDWDALKVTLEMAIKAGRIDRDWAKNRARQWGKDSAVYINRVKGDFAESDEDSVISLAWIERSNERWLARQEANDFGDVTGLGVDVGRGGDPSVICLQCEDAIKEFRKIQVKNTMHVTGLVIGLLKNHHKSKASIDVIGIGAGVVDRCREVINELRNVIFPNPNDRIIAFNAAEKTDLKDSSGELGFVDSRSAGWWNLREKLQNDEVDLPPEDELTGELVSPKWVVQSGGKIKVESKKDIKKRLGRSTNYADTVIQVYMPPPVQKMAGAFGRRKR